MGGTSRAMAPAWVVAQLCSWVDLDGPFLLKADRLPGLGYADGEARAVPRGVWG